jgi:hypothetical protein
MAGALGPASSLARHLQEDGTAEGDDRRPKVSAYLGDIKKSLQARIVNCKNRIPRAVGTTAKWSEKSPSIVSLQSQLSAEPDDFAERAGS